MGEYPGAGPVPISNAAPAVTPIPCGRRPWSLLWWAGDPQWVARAREFRTAPPPEEEADRRGRGTRLDRGSRPGR